MSDDAKQTTTTPTPTAEEVLAAEPAVRHEPGARGRIRAANVAAGRRIAALDDDPTGSQTVHDVSVVTVFEDAEYAAGLAEPGSTCFVLTNTRSLPEDAAVELTTIDRRVTPWNVARHVGSLEVCTHQDRSRGIRRAGQEALGTPQIQIVTDQEIVPALLAP